MEAETMRARQATTATVNVGGPSLLRSLLNFISGAPSQEERDPAFAAAKFVMNFEELFGPVHPAFIETSYTEAIRKARNDYKFLIIYLHSSMHTDTPDFCGGTLATEPVTDFIDSNYLIWGGDVATSEAYVLSTTLGATAYPFLAVLCNIDGNVQLVDRLEGYLGHEELIARLTHTLENQGTVLVAAQSASEERQRDRLIREEQDLAYLESLRMDQEKERKAKEEERLQQEEEERQRQEEQRKQEEEEYKLNRKTRELDRKRRELPAEPADGANIVVRLPDGSRLSRRFSQSDKIKSVYDFVDINEPKDLEMDSYELVTNYPKRVFSDRTQTLSAAGLQPQSVLYTQNL